MEGLLITIIILILIAISLEIYYFFLKHQEEASAVIRAEKNNKSNWAPIKITNTKRNDGFVFSQNDIDTFIYYLHPEDELGQYIAISIKAGQSLDDARKNLFNPTTLKEIINDKLQNADIIIEENNSYLTDRQIRKFMGTVTLNDELGQYIAASLKAGEKTSELSEKLFDSNHIKMIISNKLADLLNNIGKKRKKKKVIIKNIREYIKSEILKCTPKSEITENLLYSGYTLEDINSAVYTIESNIKGESNKEIVIKHQPKNLEIKSYIKSRKNSDGNYNYAKERLLEVGHNLEEVESLIKEVESEE